LKKIKSGVYSYQVVLDREVPDSLLVIFLKYLLLAGHCATDDYEPRQVRKEAAIRNAVCVAADPGK